MFSSAWEPPLFQGNIPIKKGMSWDAFENNLISRGFRLPVGKILDKELIKESVEYHGDSFKEKLMESLINHSCMSDYTSQLLNLRNEDFDYKKHKKPSAITPRDEELNSEATDFVCEKGPWVFRTGVTRGSRSAEPFLMKCYASLEKYKYLPPLEYYLNVWPEIREKQFYKSVSAGDVLFAKVIDYQADDTHILQIIATGGYHHRDLTGTNIKAELKWDDLMQVESSHQEQNKFFPDLNTSSPDVNNLERKMWELNTILTVEVLHAANITDGKINPGEMISVGTKGIELQNRYYRHLDKRRKKNCRLDNYRFTLGKIDIEGEIDTFPSILKSIANNKVCSYDENLKEMCFNRYSKRRLMNISRSVNLKPNICHSLMNTIHNSSFAWHELENLRAAQNMTWIQEVCDGKSVCDNEEKKFAILESCEEEFKDTSNYGIVYNKKTDDAKKQDNIILCARTYKQISRYKDALCCLKQLSKSNKMKNILLLDIILEYASECESKQNFREAKALYKKSLEIGNLEIIESSMKAIERLKELDSEEGKDQDLEELKKLLELKEDVKKCVKQLTVESMSSLEDLLEAGIVQLIEDEKFEKYNCTVCEVQMFGPTVMLHVAGDKHKKKIKRMILDKVSHENSYLSRKDIKDGLETGLLVVDSSKSSHISHYNCTLCNMAFTGMIPLVTHMDSPKHKNRYLNVKVPNHLREVIKDGLETGLLVINSSNPEHYDCTLCNMTFSGMEPLIEHIKSPTHFEAMQPKQLKWNVEKDLFYCVVCDEQILNRKDTLRHLNRKRHKTALEKKMLGIECDAELIPYRELFECGILVKLKDASNGFNIMCTVCNYTKFQENDLMSHVSGKKHKSNIDKQESSQFIHVLPKCVFWLGSIPQQATEADVIDCISGYGRINEVSIHLESDHAFFEMSKKKDADSILAAHNQKKIKILGQEIELELSKQPNVFKEKQISRVLHIGNIPLWFSYADVTGLLSVYGEIQSIKFVEQGKRNKQGEHRALVEMVSSVDSMNIMNDIDKIQKVVGRPIEIMYSQKKFLERKSAKLCANQLDSNEKISETNRIDSANEIRAKHQLSEEKTSKLLQIDNLTDAKRRRSESISDPEISHCSKRVKILHEDETIHNKSKFDLLVRGLSIDRTKQEVNEFFSDYGIIKDVHLERSKNPTFLGEQTAYIAFEKTNDSVIDLLNQSQSRYIKDNLISIQEYTSSTSTATQGAAVLVSGITHVYNDSMREIFDYFNKFGAVKIVMLNSYNKESHYAFVIFHSEEVAKEIISAKEPYVLNKDVLILNKVKLFQYDKKFDTSEITQKIISVPTDKFNPLTKQSVNILKDIMTETGAMYEFAVNERSSINQSLTIYGTPEQIFSAKILINENLRMQKGKKMEEKELEMYKPKVLILTDNVYDVLESLCVEEVDIELDTCVRILENMTLTKLFGSVFLILNELINIKYVIFAFRIQSLTKNITTTKGVFHVPKEDFVIMKDFVVTMQEMSQRLCNQFRGVKFFWTTPAPYSFEECNKQNMSNDKYATSPQLLPSVCWRKLQSNFHKCLINLRTKMLQSIAPYTVDFLKLFLYGDKLSDGMIGEAILLKGEVSKDYWSYEEGIMKLNIDGGRALRHCIRKTVQHQILWGSPGSDADSRSEWIDYIRDMLDKEQQEREHCQRDVQPLSLPDIEEIIEIYGAPVDQHSGILPIDQK